MPARAYVRTTKLQFASTWVGPTAALSILLLAIASTTSESALPLLSHLWMGALPLGLLLGAVTALFGLRSGVGEAHVDKAGLRWKGDPLIDSLIEGETVVRRSGTSVRLRGRQGAAVLSVENAKEAEELLEAAGLDLDRAHTYHLRQADSNIAVAGGGVALAFFTGLSIAAAVPGVGIAIAAALLVAALAAAVWSVRRASVTLTVGADGLALREGSGKPRFFPYREVESAALTFDSGQADGLVLRFADGRSQKLAVPPSSDKPDAEEPARAIVARIHRCRKASPGENAERGAVAALLSQGGRSTAEWIASLRSVLAGTGSYRTMPVSIEDLKAVVRDGTAQKKTRLAAAIALGAADRDGGKAEVHEAATACAAEDLATKFRIAVEDHVDEARLGEALDDLDEREAEDDAATGASRSRSS